MDEVLGGGGDFVVIENGLLQEFAKWYKAKIDSDLPKTFQLLCSIVSSEGSLYEVPSIIFDQKWYSANQKLRGKKSDAGSKALEHYIEIGIHKGFSPNSWFNENFYRSAYPDVDKLIREDLWKCGFQHYLIVGMSEHRSPMLNFNELSYLGLNPDVLLAVRAGEIPSGFLHYITLGKLENRQIHIVPPPPLLSLPTGDALGTLAPSTSFAEEIYQDLHRDVQNKDVLSPGMKHWLSFGLKEDSSGARRRIPRWVDSIYLRENSDLGPYIGARGQPTPYSHFLMYGHAEGREWAGSLWKRHEQGHLTRAMSSRTISPQSSDDAESPLITVIVPVYNPAPSVLMECIESVRKQTYFNWELCLVDDGSNVPEVIETLLSAERSDSRIRITFALKNSGISNASNLALSQSHGEFVSLLDHDDLLAPDALLHVARALMSKPNVDMVYTDEGKLTEDGKLIDLNPKPDWSPELLLSTMYIGHLTTYRRSVIDKVGGFRSLFDGTQDYDLALRAAEVVRSVIHVALPLYFWRMSPASTAGSVGAKPGAFDLQRQALENTLLRRGLPGKVVPWYGLGHWATIIDPPHDQPLVSIVIPTAGRSAMIGNQSVDLVVNCIQSLISTETYPNVEYVVVHNGDLRPETLIGLAACGHVHLVLYDDSNFNLSNKINLGVESASGKFVLLLNDDMQAESTGIVQSMLGCMFEGVAIVGGRLLYANGTLQHAGVVWTADGPTHAMIGEHRTTPGPENRLQIMHNALAVSGACMFFRRDLFLEVGGFSPRLPTNYNDVDICLKFQTRGMRIVFNPAVTLFHFESISKKGTHFWELQLLLISYPGLTDPYVNPTFSKRSPFYELVDLSTSIQPSHRAWMIDRIGRRRGCQTSLRQIRFSIIMSVYQNLRYQMEELQATIFNQTYDNWEWIIVDDGSTLQETLAWLEQARTLPNVTVIRLSTNKGIMTGYGTAFRAAVGDYVVPVDADDFLTLDCLQVLASSIEANDRPALVYSDEDKSDERGMTHSPFLKPDWDPILFSNICYVCHVCAINRSAAEEAGCYTDQQADWCHDWDTIYRLSRAGASIVHVPEVLYSWRIHAGSTASMATGTKPQTITSQKHVLDQHLELTGLCHSFKIVQNELFPHDGIWRLQPVAVSLENSALLLIATENTQRLSSLLLKVSQSLTLDTMVIMVGDVPSTIDALTQLPNEIHLKLGRRGAVRLRHEMSLTDAMAVCSAMNCTAIAVLDTGVADISPNWLSEGFGMFAAAEDIGAVGGQVILSNGQVLWRGGFRGFGGMADSPDYGQQASNSGYHGMAWCQKSCDAVPSVCFFARVDLLTHATANIASGNISLRELAGYVAEKAWDSDLRIVYTPFVTATLARAELVGPIIEGRQNLQPRKNRTWYSGNFGQQLNNSYCVVSE